VLVALLLAVVVAEGPLQRWERSLSPAFDRLDSGGSWGQPGAKTVTILGACLPSQMLRHEQIAEAIGDGVRVVDLSAPASFTLDWRLLVAHELPDDGSLMAVLVAYNPRDLLIAGDLRESAMLQLARPRDLPMLVAAGCGNVDCAADLSLRVASSAYRQRDFAALTAWTWLAQGRVGPVLGQDGMGGRGRGDLEVSPFFDSYAARQRFREQRRDGVNDFAAQQGWRGDRTWDGTPEAAARALAEMVAEARARGARVLFVPLPRNPDSPVIGITAEERAALDRAYAGIADAGGELLGAIGDGALTATDFKDDVHASGAGRGKISRLIGQAVAAQLANPAPPAPTAP